MTMEMSEVYPGETWVELKSGGKDTVMLDGDDFPMKWTLDGESITISIEEVDSVGRLTDGVITVDLMDMGVELTFLKEGAEIPAPEVTYQDAGYWEIVRMESKVPESAISFTEENMTVSYTLENGEMKLDMIETVLVLRKGEKPEPVASEMEQAGFTYFMEEGEPYAFINWCADNEELETFGEATVVSYEIFESADGYAPLEGLSGVRIR